MQFKEWLCLRSVPSTQCMLKSPVPSTLNSYKSFEYYYTAKLLQSSIEKMSLDILKSEIAVKRKAIAEDPVLSGRPNKYMRKGELERLKLEQEQKEREEKEKSKKEQADALELAVKAKV